MSSGAVSHGVDWSLAFQVAQFLIMGAIALGIWLNTRGEKKGRADERQELARTAADKAIEFVKQELGEKADCDRVTQLEARLQGEHDERKRQMEELNGSMGRVREQQARQDERLKNCERATGMLNGRWPGGGQPA